MGAQTFHVLASTVPFIHSRQTRCHPPGAAGPWTSDAYWANIRPRESSPRTSRRRGRRASAASCATGATRGFRRRASFTNRRLASALLLAKATRLRPSPPAIGPRLRRMRREAPEREMSPNQGLARSLRPARVIVRMCRRLALVVVRDVACCPWPPELMMLSNQCLARVLWLAMALVWMCGRPALTAGRDVAWCPMQPELMMLSIRCLFRSLCSARAPV
mmetsp:Transcript_146328/g.469431  ORF Transcript_146328/g.469431 Transcript_146328/m.469431 type:complete len:219 (+) Transcript_146328:270-926(+)